MLTTSTRPATREDLAVPESVYVTPPDRSVSGVATSLFLAIAGVVALGVGLAALMMVIPTNAVGRVVLTGLSVIAIAVGGLCWRGAWHTTFGRKHRQRRSDPDPRSKLVEQWRCVAFKYYFWDVSGDLPCLLAVTQSGDLLQVQTQDVDDWIDYESVTPPTLGCICRLETIGENPHSLCFEGAKVPIEFVDDAHPSAGLRNLDLSMIRVPRQTFEQLSQPRRG